MEDLPPQDAKSRFQLVFRRVLAAIRAAGATVHEIVLAPLERDDVGRSGEDPALTGGDFVFLSPGLRLAVREPWAAYVFVQQPLYQDVNGLQLTAKRNWLFGVQGRW